ncbi:MAG: hypothetical protein EBU88_16450 [Acidobacteria bacterium]|nr:hypothetical protein [Acidobacteriota bacterium]
MNRAGDSTWIAHQGFSLPVSDPPATTQFHKIFRIFRLQRDLMRRIAPDFVLNPRIWHRIQESPDAMGFSGEK